MATTIRQGDRVVLPDGTEATVTRSLPRVGELDDGTVEVTHLDRSLGRGPWIYLRSELSIAAEQHLEVGR